MNQRFDCYQNAQEMDPIRSIARCPVCDGGRCGIRICTGDDPTEAIPTRGFIMCDECEAVWLEPDIKSGYIYLNPEQPKCPICHGGLWGNSRWATRDEVTELGWNAAVNDDLNADADA